jgi:hypothetical protein
MSGVGNDCKRELIDILTKYANRQIEIEFALEKAEDKRQRRSSAEYLAVINALNEGHPTVPIATKERIMQKLNVTEAAVSNMIFRLLKADAIECNFEQEETLYSVKKINIWEFGNETI